MISTLRRRLVVVSLATVALVVLGLASAGSAGAAVPEGWETPDKVDKLHALLVLGGIPLLLCVVIAVLVYLPSMIRGESLAPATAPESQWLGGPRKSAAELAAPDGDDSAAGGASGSW